MKKIIFVFLLPLAGCISAPSISHPRSEDQYVAIQRETQKMIAILMSQITSIQMDINYNLRRAEGNISEEIKKYAELIDRENKRGVFPRPD